MDYFKYSGFSIRGLRHLMFSILHQIHIFDAPYLTPNTHLQCSVSYTRYTSPMLRILYQIHIFVNSKLGSSQPSPHASNSIRTKPLRCTPVKLGCHRPTRLWPLLSSQYPNYLMKKLTSSQEQKTDCVQLAPQPHHQPWRPKVVNPTLW